MFRNPLTWLLLFLVSSALAGCCGSVACNCPNDKLDDALYFRFNVDTLRNPRQSFRINNLRAVFIRRVPLDTAQRPRADTAVVTARPGYVTSFIINNSTPFVQSGTRKLDRYTYKVYLGTRRAPKDSFILRNLALESEFVGNGCCTCNVNKRKDVVVNDRPYSLVDPTGQDRADTILFNRRP